MPDDELIGLPAPPPRAGAEPPAGQHDDATDDDLAAAWGLEVANRYSPDRFYTKARDASGHSSEVRVKLTPAMRGQLDALVASQAIPQYRTIADFLRDAFVHRIIQVQEMLREDGDAIQRLQPFVRTLRREAEIDAITAKWDHWRAVIDKLKASLTRALSDGNYDVAWALVRDNQDAEDMDPSYARELENVIDDARDELERIAEREQSRSRPRRR